MKSEIKKIQPYSPDLVMVGSHDRVRDAIADMFTAVTGENYVFGYVDIKLALLVIEIAKRAEDSLEWFPHGKWATIQAIQANVDIELNKLFQTVEE